MDLMVYTGNDGNGIYIQDRSYYRVETRKMEPKLYYLDEKEVKKNFNIDLNSIKDLIDFCYEKPPLFLSKFHIINEDSNHTNNIEEWVESRKRVMKLGEWVMKILTK